MSNSPKNHQGRPSDDLVVQSRTERDALGRLYDTIYPEIFCYCLRRVNCRSLAEDLTSSVFMIVARKITTFPGETYQDFRRWVFTIATNEIAASYRKTNRRKALLEKAVFTGTIRAESTLDEPKLSDTEDVKVAILQLGERDQSIVTLRFFSELSYDDIAKILNIGPGAARTATSRAIEKMRVEIEGRHERK